MRNILLIGRINDSLLNIAKKIHNNAEDTTLVIVESLDDVDLLYFLDNYKNYKKVFTIDIGNIIELDSLLAFCNKYDFDPEFVLDQEDDELRTFFNSVNETFYDSYAYIHNEHDKGLNLFIEECRVKLNE